MAEQRLCPRCQVNELPPRCRVCDDCLNGVTVDRSLTRPPEVRRLLTVVSCLRRVREREVELACTCRVRSETLWQEDDYRCTKHGPTWVARISRGDEQ